MSLKVVVNKLFVYSVSVGELTVKCLCPIPLLNALLCGISSSDVVSPFVRCICLVQSAQWLPSIL